MDERLAERRLDRGHGAPQQGEDVHLPQRHRGAEHEYPHQAGQHQPHGVDDDEQQPLVEAVGQLARVQGEQHHRGELQRGDHAERGGGVVRDLQYEPVLRGDLYPPEDEGDQLPEGE